MQSRVFTIEEVNDLIPKVEPLVSELMDKKNTMQKQHGELLILNLLSGTETQEKQNPESEEYLTKSAELEALILSFEDIIVKINEMGGVLKDIEKGLVDFLHVRNKELVYLCWKKGEKKVTCWHAVNDGFDDREPI